MEILPFLVVFLLGITVASSIILPNKVNYYNGGHHPRSCSFESESSSSEEEHHRPHRPHHDRQCPDTWMPFRRTQGLWCVKVFYAPSDQPTAESFCQTYGATLSGVQDAAERMKVADAGRVLLGQNGGGTGGLWIGSKRKSECPNIYSCDKMNSFVWTDGNTVGTAGLDWPATEPNGLINNVRAQHCLILEISTGPIANYGYAHGQLDDEYCDSASKTFACGKLAE